MLVGQRRRRDVYAGLELLKADQVGDCQRWDTWILVRNTYRQVWLLTQYSKAVSYLLTWRTVDSRVQHDAQNWKCNHSLALFWEGPLLTFVRFCLFTACCGGEKPCYSFSSLCTLLCLMWWCVFTEIDLAILLGPWIGLYPFGIYSVNTKVS